MHILYTILIGFVVGLLAKLLTPGRDPSGFFITAAIGIAGALLAKAFQHFFLHYPHGHPVGFLASLLGAIVLLVIYHMVRPRTP